MKKEIKYHEILKYHYHRLYMTTVHRDFSVCKLSPTVEMVNFTNKSQHTHSHWIFTPQNAN